MKLKKVAYCSSLPHFALSTMHEVVDEAILSNTFSKTAQLHLESCSWSYFLKKQLTNEVELCQTSPIYVPISPCEEDQVLLLLFIVPYVGIVAPTTLYGGQPGNFIAFSLVKIGFISHWISGNGCMFLNLTSSTIATCLSDSFYYCLFHNCFLFRIMWNLFPYYVQAMCAYAINVLWRIAF